MLSKRLPGTQERGLTSLGRNIMIQHVRESREWHIHALKRALGVRPVMTLPKSVDEGERCLVFKSGNGVAAGSARCLGFSMFLFCKNLHGIKSR
jgi:hypothetical protein